MKVAEQFKEIKCLLEKSIEANISKFGSKTGAKIRKVCIGRNDSEGTGVVIITDIDE